MVVKLIAKSSSRCYFAYSVDKDEVSLAVIARNNRTLPSFLSGTLLTNHKNEMFAMDRSVIVKTVMKSLGEYHRQEGGNTDFATWIDSLEVGILAIKKQNKPQEGQILAILVGDTAYLEVPYEGNPMVMRGSAGGKIGNNHWLVINNRWQSPEKKYVIMPEKAYNKWYRNRVLDVEEKLDAYILLSDSPVDVADASEP